MEAVVMPLNVDPTADPPESGGLLLAFAHLRQLLLDPEGFTEFSYLGSEPFDGTGPMVDVLMTTRGLHDDAVVFRATGAAASGVGHVGGGGSRRV